MLNRVNNFFWIIVAVLIFSAVSCAKENEDYSPDSDNTSLMLWLKTYRPDMLEHEVSPGLYIKKHEGSEFTKIPIIDGYWAKITLTGQTLNGTSINNVYYPNYFLNMYPEGARKLDRFSYYTHYTPEYVPYYAGYYTDMLTKGQHTALGNMYQGDSVEIFMTSKYAYGTNAFTPSVSGFKGNVSVLQGVGMPIYMTMVLNSSIKSPSEYELNTVNSYAQGELRLQLKDSIKKGLFLKIIKSNPKGDTIKVDTTVNVRYTGRFLDKFVFDTNIESVAKENHIYSSTSKYTSLQVTLSTSSMLEGFNKAIRKMRVGETAIAVFTSSYGYGISGNSSGNTVIQPYTPLVFEIRILTPEEQK